MTSPIQPWMVISLGGLCCVLFLLMVVGVVVYLLRRDKVAEKTSALSTSLESPPFDPKPAAQHPTAGPGAVHTRQARPEIDVVHEDDATVVNASLSMPPRAAPPTSTPPIPAAPSLSPPVPPAAPIRPPSGTPPPAAPVAPPKGRASGSTIIAFDEEDDS